MKKKNIVILLVLSVLAIYLILGPYQEYSYRKFKAYEWKETILVPDGISIRDSLNSPLIKGSIKFKNEVYSYNIETVFAIRNLILNSSSVISISSNKANNADEADYYIGTIRHNSHDNINYFSTVNVYKNGTFIASKTDALHNEMFIKGKLPKGGFEYIRNLYDELSSEEDNSSHHK